MQDLRVEKVREDGTRLEIHVRLGEDLKFRVTDVGVKPKGKRKYTYVCGKTLTDRYDYRKLYMEGRLEFRKEEMLKECPKELMEEVVEEVVHDAWMKLKPDGVLFQ